MKEFLSICLLFLVNGLFGQSNLIGHWPLDSNALDISGNNYHGTIFGATPDTGHAGLPGTAYRFDGVNDYIVIDEDSAFDFETLDTFEITFWMKPDLNYIGGSSNDMISKWKDQTNSNDDYPFCIRILNTGGQDFGKIYSVRFSRSCLQSPRTTSKRSLRDSQWHFVQFSRSSDDSLRLYIDYALQETSWDSTTCSTANDDSLYFGRKGGTKNHGFYKGLLDDIKIYGGRIYTIGLCGLDTTLTITSNAIVSNENKADHYQWYKCDSGMVKLTGDTNMALYPSSNGHYILVLSSDTCSDSSACMPFTLIGISEESDKEELILFPNPAENYISFNIQIEEGSEYHIFNALGERVDEGILRKDIITVSKLPPGFYLVQIVQKEGILRAFFQEVISFTL